MSKEWEPALEDRRYDYVLALQGTWRTNYRIVKNGSAE